MKVKTSLRVGTVPRERDRYALQSPVHFARTVLAGVLKTMDGLGGCDTCRPHYP